MLLTHNQILDLIAAGVIEGADPARVNAASLDVTLSNQPILVEDLNQWDCLDLAAKESPKFLQHLRRHDESGDYWLLRPGDFCLASTAEIFHLPNDIAIEYKLKSSLARVGLGHLLAGWGDPGWHGSALTLELVNHLTNHSFKLRPGMPIGQIVFWRGEPVPDHASYATRGQYNGDRAATASKGIR